LDELWWRHTQTAHVEAPYLVLEAVLFEIGDEEVQVRGKECSVPISRLFVLTCTVPRQGQLRSIVVHLQLHCVEILKWCSGKPFRGSLLRMTFLSSTWSTEIAILYVALGFLVATESWCPTLQNNL
jgi:hypothetical protein